MPTSLVLAGSMPSDCISLSIGSLTAPVSGAGAIAAEGEADDDDESDDSDDGTCNIIEDRLSLPDTDLRFRSKKLNTSHSIETLLNRKLKCQ